MLVNIHHAIQQVEDLNPQEPDIHLWLAVPDLKVHEGFAEQGGCAQPRLRHAFWITGEHWGPEQLVHEGEENAIEYLVHLLVIGLVVHQLGAEEESLQLTDGTVAHLTRSVRRLPS